MSYKALYRTWRPQTLKDVVGQNHVSRTLNNALISDKVAHAYLFCGPRGTGKTSSAKILAKAVNCLSLVEGEPCNECSHCEAINKGSFLDVFEIDAASNRGIDEIRDIRDKVKFAPSQGKCKVYIIDEVHMLTPEAFNALLKTLEEPPKHVLFILATTEPQKIPLTILSRCQRFDFRKIKTDEIKTHLELIVEEINIEITKSALLTIARKADGGMRDAISLLDQCIAFAGSKIVDSDVENVLGTLSEEQIISISDALITGDAAKAILYLNDYLQSGKDIKQILRDLIEHFRSMMLLKVSNQEDIITLNAQMLSKIKEQANTLSLRYIGRIVTKLTDVEKELRWTSAPQILVEASLIDIILGMKAISENNEKIVEEKNTKEHIPAAEELNPIIKEKPERKKMAKTNKKPQLEEIKKKWPEILEEVKKEKITTHAFLIMGEPFDLTPEGLIIIFEKNYKFHRDRINLPENKELVKKAIEEILGAQINILCTIEGETNSKEERPGKSDIDKALEIFGEEIVEIKD